MLLVGYSMGFTEVNYVAAFEEYELQYRVAESDVLRPNVPPLDEEVLQAARQALREHPEDCAQNKQQVLERGSHGVVTLYNGGDE
jgi:FMN-dependent NADH-azoreductase